MHREITHGHTAADVADFEGFIETFVAAKSGEQRVSLEQFLRANPGYTHKDWKHGTEPRLCEAQVDAGAPKSGVERIQYVRTKATRYLAHTLPLDIRQQAARDPALIWNPLARRYRLRTAEEAEERCASASQYLDQPDTRASPPAPAPTCLDGDREGQSESLWAPTLATGAGLEFNKSDRFSIGEQ